MNMLNIPFPKLNFDDDVILSDILTKELIEQAEKEEKMVVVPIPFSAIENTRNDEDRVMWARGYMYACVSCSELLSLPVGGKNHDSGYNFAASIISGLQGQEAPHLSTSDPTRTG